MAIGGLGLAARLLMLLAFAALTYSVRNTVTPFVLMLPTSPVGIPMAADGILAVLNKKSVYRLF